MVDRAYDRALEAMAVAALALMIVAGSAFIWIGLPALGFWVGGKLTTSAEGFLLFVLGAIPLAMVGFGWLLYRVASLYERMRGRGGSSGGPRSAWLVSSSDERASNRRISAPRSLIDVSMAVSAVVALVLFLAYFFFVGETRLVTPP
jgi:preprotein translocase subunit Sec61beta